MQTLEFNDYVTHFPMTLDENRYIEFNFFKDDLMKDVVTGLEKVIGHGANAIGKLGKGDTSGATKEIKAGGTTLLKTGSKVFKTLGSNINERIKDGDLSSKKAQSDTKNGKEWIYQINLPIPNQLEESLKHDWDTDNGPVSSIMKAGMEKGVGGVSVQSVVNGIAALTGTRNIVANPDYIQMYKGSQPRNISFSWILMPNNLEEADRILSIVRRFKSFSSGNPSTSNAFLTAPLFCNVVIKNDKLSNTIKLTNMVIDSVSINYSETSFMEMFADGMPKTIVLSISMIERKVKMAKDWLSDDITIKYNQEYDGIRTLNEAKNYKGQ